jgi:hypothetical protein
MKITRKYSRRLAQIIGSPTPWLFLIGVIAVGLIVEGTSRLVDSSLTGQPWQVAAWIIGIGFGLLFITVLFFNLPRVIANISKAFFTQSHVPTVAVAEQVPRRQGLVVLVSLGDYTAAASALEYHAWDLVPGSRPVLTHCWLIAGPGEGESSSLANAERIKEELMAKGIMADIWSLEDADNVQESFQAVKTIFQVATNKYKLAKDEIMADYTGGTKSMTSGMLLAAIAEGIDLQYMKPNLYLADGRADRPAGSRPRFVRINFVSVSDEG